MGNSNIKELKEIVKTRIETSKNVTDYLKNLDTNFPLVEERCLAPEANCTPICKEAICTGNPDIKGLIAYFKIGRFQLQKNDGSIVVIQNKIAEYCSEIVSKISRQIEIINGNHENTVNFYEAKLDDMTNVDKTFNISTQMTDLDIFKQVYNKVNGPVKWAFIYNNKKYVYGERDWELVENPHFKSKKSKKANKRKSAKSVKKSKKIVKSTKAKSKKKIKASKHQSINV